MTESSDGGRGELRGVVPPGQHEQEKGRSASDSWEQRAAGLAGEMQRWLIKSSAKSVRDEFGGQVRKAFRGSDSKHADSWATATNEPPDAADEPPECAWCPVCRAARRIARARPAADGSGGPRLSDAADVVASAVRDALAGLDALLSYRPTGPVAEPGEPAAARPDAQSPAGPPAPAAGPGGAAPEAETTDVKRSEPENEPGDRG
jgi:hypothetical protein